MVKNAERFSAEDELMRKRVEAKNQLENYIFSIKQSVNDTLKDKLEAADKTQIEALTAAASSVN